jgi:hypothetical protein
MRSGTHPHDSEVGDGWGCAALPSGCESRNRLGIQPSRTRRRLDKHGSRAIDSPDGFDGTQEWLTRAV